MSGIDPVVEEILPQVERPSRYLGTELNSVRKDPATVRVRVALIFPDLYDLGLGNLGLHILYAILNQQPDVWAERVYAPGLDLEEQLRRRGLPLFSLESRTPLNEFDCLGFTLQSELTYTNVLNLLDLSGLPLLAAGRDARHPLVIAGGPGAFNPEPLADFIDAFVIGEGEEAVLEVVEVLRGDGLIGNAKCELRIAKWEGTDGELKGTRWKARREEQWRRLAAVPGVYVPALYPTRALKDGTIMVADPQEPPSDGRWPASNFQFPISKRLVSDLDAAPFPTDYIVPFTQQVHDHVSLEVLRGCTQGCRFCHAGMTTRPVRERSLEQLGRLMREALAKTGYEELSLMSLSTCDYSRVRSLVQQSVAWAEPERISVSLPSLRLDSFSVELADLVRSIRKTGLTFAPEAATDRLRAVINKPISDEAVLETVRECFARGWDLVKLYFMVGLPTETDEDVAAIADLANRVLAVGQKIRKRVKLHLGVSTFVPQPHTPFQWDEQISLEETERRQALLVKGLRRDVKFGWHDPRASYLEGVIARGDRRVGKLLLEAFRRGCKFDAWGDRLAWEQWQAAFHGWEEETGTRTDSLLRARGLEEPLPWDHIDPLVSKEWLKADYRRSREAVWRGDCRSHPCHHCGVIDRERDLCLTMQRRSRKGKQEEAERTFTPPRREEPEPVQRLRFRFARRGAVRLLSHLETINVFIRALRRAQMPLSYSQGFHPQPKLAFGAALPVGMESEGEYADVTFTARVEPDAFRAALNATLPEGFEILAAQEIPLKAPALMATIHGAEYELCVPTDLIPEGDEPLTARLKAYLAQEEIRVDRRTKKGVRTLNIRPMIADLQLVGQAEGQVTVRLRLVDHEGQPGKPAEVAQTLWEMEAGDRPRVRIRKLDSYAGDRPLLSSERV